MKLNRKWNMVKQTEEGHYLVEGDLNFNCPLVIDIPGRLVVKGKIQAYGSIISKCDLVVTGRIEAKNRLTISGDVNAGGDIVAGEGILVGGNITTEGFVKAGGNITAEHIYARNGVRAAGQIRAKVETIDHTAVRQPAEPPKGVNMTVRELLDFVAPSVRIFIKPSGRRTYYAGTAGEAPESLMDAKVLEINAKLADDDDIPVLGIWVEHIEVWDWLVDGIPDMKEFPDMADAWYCRFKENPEFYKQDITAGIAKNREQRMARYYTQGVREPDRAERCDDEPGQNDFEFDIGPDVKILDD